MRGLAERHGVVYLEHEAATLGGLRVFGSPITPEFRAMAFNRPRGQASAEVWARVPEQFDLLVTHGPPHRLGDRTFLGMHVGCEALRARVPAIAPRLHVFGHIHESFGEYTVEGLPTRFLNVASRPLVPLGVRAPVVVDLA